MIEDAEDLPKDALEDVAYLARSSNRVAILAALASGPHASRDLAEMTSASRSTLERILTELEERGWAERRADGYLATPVGERVLVEFTPLVARMRAIRSLGDAIAWLPDEGSSVDLRHFRDATIRRPNPNSPIAGATYLLDLMREASAFYNLTYIAPPLSLLQSMCRGVVEGRLTARNVLTDDLVSHLREQAEQIRYWREYVENGARVYRYEGRIPCNVFVVDETVLVANNDPEAGHPCEFIEISNGPVRSWARDLIETYREDAERLTAEAFSEGQSTGRTG